MSPRLVIDFNPELLGKVMNVAFVVLLVFFLVLAVVLSYHWRKYGVAKIKAAIFMLIYLVGGLVLIGAMTTSKLSF